jgi:hypothetical protein
MPDGGASAPPLPITETTTKRRPTMGLDMYAFTTSTSPDDPVDFTADDPKELHYWRKHPNLHGWMHQLYRLKGGSDPQFNCVNVVLTGDDLDRLERCILDDALPYTTGFFFGASIPEDRDGDLAFIAKAREAIGQGLTVFYTSWW